MPKQNTNAIDLAYRPDSYFWAMDSNIKLSSDIKGAERKAIYERAIQSGNNFLANSLIADPDLSYDERTSLGRMHPNFMVVSTCLTVILKKLKSHESRLHQRPKT